MTMTVDYNTRFTSDLDYDFTQKKNKKQLVKD